MRMIWVTALLLCSGIVFAKGFEPSDTTEWGPLNDNNLSTGKDTTFYASLYYPEGKNLHWIVIADKHYNIKIPEPCYQYQTILEKQMISVVIYEQGLWCMNRDDEFATSLKNISSSFIYEEWMR